MSGTLTKAGIVDRVQASTGLPRSECLTLVEALLEQMKAALEAGDNLKVSGFGTFLLHDKKARRGRNPVTEEAMTITPRRVLTFKPSPILRHSLNPEKE